MKRLGLIMLSGTIYLAAWTLRKFDSPKEESKQDSNNLRYETCTVTEWNFGSMASKKKLNKFNLIYDSLCNVYF